jgi:hypothetical protein
MSETQPSLNVNDIAAGVKLIDIAAEQGAYRGWELIRQALLVRDRLNTFVVAANAQVNSSATSSLD